jgi:hypothetical protein
MGGLRLYKCNNQPAGLGVIIVVTIYLKIYRYHNAL